MDKIPPILEIGGILISSEIITNAFVATTKSVKASVAWKAAMAPL